MYNSHYRSLSGSFILFLALPLLLNFNLFAQDATIKEETRSILTYPFSDPNPVPVMALNSMVRPFYPYFIFDGYTDKGEWKDWKVITLDNEYITVTILPEVGGKVWGAVEKSTGKEFVYQNDVMKFRAIGIRGPWTSGGIEHNFGLDLGHAPWTASPVDYYLKKEPDGSVSCTVGGLDLASRTQWRVKIRLPEGKAYFETSSMWYNPTPLHDAYLSWENAAFKASEDLQFFLPGNYYIGHDGAVKPWPVDDQGRNLDMYRENNFGSSKSYHVSGFYSTWFGGYWHDSGFGFGHWTPYSDAPGKKIWIWSLARDGAIWEDLLTDNHGQYIEAQSGVKFNQANPESGYHSPYNQLSIRPFYTETKDERWFPVLGIGGMSAASGAGTIFVTRTDGSLKVSVSPVVPVYDTLKIYADGKVIFSDFIRLEPLQLYEQILESSISENSTIQVTIGGNLLTYYSDDREITTDRPDKTIISNDYTSAEHFFYLAEDMNAMRDYPGALQHYLTCLEKESIHTRALYRIAEMYYRMGLYEEALQHARRALEINTYDPGSNFISGVIHRKLGDKVRAEEAFSVAARSMEFRSGSYLQIAELRMAVADYSCAAAYSQKALDFNRYNIPARECLATCFRKINKPEAASAILDELLEIDPLDHYARFEKYLAEPTEDHLNDFRSLIRNELPQETYLELAVSYINRGLREEAEKVLELAPSCPEVFYWLAFLNRQSSTEKSRDYLMQAAVLSPDFEFPSRHEAIPVLEWAMQQDDSWKTKYYLGLIWWNMNRTDKTLELFALCSDKPDWAPFYLARAILFQRNGNNGTDVLNDLKKAVNIGPGEWRTWHFLSTYYRSAGSFSELLVNTREAYKHFPANPVIGIDLAKALIHSGDFNECLRVLEKIRILPQEGAHEGHDIFELANLSLAVQLPEQKKYREALQYLENSKRWPENLGAGRPYDPDERLQDYLLAYCYRKTGDTVMEKKCQQQIIEYSRLKWGGDSDPSNICIANQVFVENGLVDEAAIEMKQWIAEQDSLRNWSISAGSSSRKVRWVIARYYGKYVEAKALEEEIASVPTEVRFRLLLKTLDMINSGTE
jgi:tetratricopeptide (TPR) repeat protein